MSSKVRLWLNLITIVAVFIIIVISIGAVFKKSSTFLNPPGIDNKVKDLNMDIIGKIDGENFFEVKFINGQANKEIDNLKIDEVDTTFTEEKTTLSYTLSFENKSTGTIYIKITGIYFDEFQRFTTAALVSNIEGNPIYRENNAGNGTILFEIPKTEGESIGAVDVTLTYTLEMLNRKIDNVKQDLNILISNEAIER
jgi:hypothetical protein